MKKWTLLLLSTALSFVALFAQQNYEVEVRNNFFDPAELSIKVGDTVTWANFGGLHNINGSTATYPGNPEGFSNGAASTDLWTFQHVFSTPGTYTYQCDPHVGQNMIGTITVELATASESALILTAVFDGPLPGGLPKGIELYVAEDIADLSLYGVGSATNGGGTDSIEYTFPAVAADAGDFLYLTEGEADAFTAFFGFAPDFVDESGGAVNINGDDAIELFFNGEVVDVFGEIDVDGTGEPWEYLDGWAYRVNGTGPDGSTFVLANWSFSGINALDNETDNTTAAVPVPVGTYNPEGTAVIAANNDVVSTDVNTPVTIDILANDQIPTLLTSVALTTDPVNGQALLNADNTVTYTPNMDFCGTDTFDYEICDDEGCSVATVTVTVICPTDFPEYTIGQVNTVDAEGVGDSVGVACALRGIVYGLNLRPDGLQFTLIDEAGDGIGTFSGNMNFGYTVQEGDEVRVEGVIDQFNGFLQIILEGVTLLSTGNDLLAPTVVTALGEDTESQLVKVENVSLVDPSAWGGGGGGFNVEVTDGSNTITVRIDNDVDLFNMPAPTGTFSVTGIGGQFDNSAPFTEGYQLLPRYMADIDPYNPGGGQEFPAYTIGAVTTVDNEGVADSLGVDCELRGVVYGVNMRGSGLQFTIIDGDGDGIGTFSPNDDFGYTVNEGDEVVIQGTISQFNGLTQIDIDDLDVLSTGNPLFSPLVVTQLGEVTESQLVRIENLTLVNPNDWNSSGSSFNVDVTNGSQTFTVRVNTNTTLAGTAGPGTQTFRITGIGGQFDPNSPFTDGYQLLPRYVEDLEITSQVQDPTLGALIAVYPNPAREQLTLELGLRVAQLSLYNSLGQRLYREADVEGHRTLSLAGLAPGMYTLLFEQAGRSWTERVIVK